MNTKVLKALFADKINLLLVGALALVGGGASLNAGTTAYFTDTQTVTDNNFTTATVSLAAPSFTVYDFSRIVPGDALNRSISIVNTSDISVPYFLVTKAATSTGLDTDATNGLRLVLLRCGTETAPAVCTGATTFSTVQGVMGSAQTVTTTAAGIPTTSSYSVNTSDQLVFTGGNVSGTTTITGVPLITKLNSTGTDCNTTGTDGACFLGGYSAVTVQNPSIAVGTGGLSFTVPPHTSNVAGLGTGAGDKTDYLLLYVYLPTGSASTTAQQNAFQNLASVVTFGFSAVQPTGVSSASTGTTSPGGR